MRGATDRECRLQSAECRVQSERRNGNEQGKAADMNESHIKRREELLAETERALQAALIAMSTVLVETGLDYALRDAHHELMTDIQRYRNRLHNEQAFEESLRRARGRKTSELRRHIQDLTVIARLTKEKDSFAQQTLDLENECDRHLRLISTLRKAVTTAKRAKGRRR